MPTIISRGAFSGKAFGLTGQTATPVYIEDVFSTYLYTGNGSTQTITNNIDLSTKGGMVWAKKRNGADDHVLWDTARGREWALNSNQTVQQQGPSGAGTDLTSFNTSGFSLGTSSYDGKNDSGATYASWTFRKQPKFFDVVTYTGNGANRTIAHNLGSVPGMIIVKRTDTTSNWQVYHVGLTSAANSIQLNLTAAEAAATTVWNSTAPTSSVFSVGTDVSVNANGGTYVAYLFANQAGGFGLSGSDSVVACGRFDAIAPTPYGNVTLGWEPQFLLLKQINSPGSDWYIIDTMRGFSQTQGSDLKPNTTAVEGSYWAGAIVPTATGFNIPVNLGSVNYIYLAIRRGPMKVPTSGTSVFSPIARTGTGVAATVSGVGFPFDLNIIGNRVNASAVPGQGFAFDRLRGPSTYNFTSQIIAEDVTGISGLTQNGYTIASDTPSGAYNFNTWTYINWFFRRAPSFFDVVCYTGTGVARTVAHNLGVAPEFILVKGRSGTGTGLNWTVYAAPLGANTFMVENDGQEAYVGYPTIWNNTSPTASVFSVGTANYTNGPSNTFVAYLFATCPGVSKVGSYTGTGTAQNINCGFSAGARFVLIKRTDSAGGWHVYDSARGISSGNDPYLLLNSTAAEVTGTNYVDTFASGFTLTATAPAALNANGGSYIFLAIS